MVDPLYYVKGDAIFQRPTETKEEDGTTSVTMGFSICTVHDGVDPAELCALLNRSGDAFNDGH